MASSWFIFFSYHNNALLFDSQIFNYCLVYISRNSKLVEWLVFEVHHLGSILGWVRNCLRHCIQTGSPANLVSYLAGTAVSLLHKLWSWQLMKHLSTMILLPNLPIGLYGVTCQQMIFTHSTWELRIPVAENTVDTPMVRKVHLFTYLLTPCSRALHEKLTVL